MSNFNPPHHHHQQYSPSPIIPPAAMNAHALSQMRTAIADFVHSLHRERYLDEEFTKIRELQDDSCPDFVIKVANVFFKDCQRIICDMDIALRVQVVDFKKIVEKVHQLKGSSSSFGAARVHEVCVKLRPLCESKNRDGCIRCLHELHNEAAELQNKLHLLFWYEQRFINAGGTFSKVE